MLKKFKILAFTFCSFVFIFSSCKKEEKNISSPQQSTGTPDYSEKGANPDDAFVSDAQSRSSHEGYLYTESNATSQNEILCYKQHGDGSLSLTATVNSGGNGIGIYAGLGLDGQGALALSENHRYLFAVNAGSNSISSFEVHNDGSLTLAHTINSSGTTPVSLCCYKHYLYVVNSASSDICGYTIGNGGTLTMIPGTNLSLSSAGSDPAQISFSPNGEYLYVTEKANNKITSYDVNTNGVATFDVSYNSTGNTPFGFSIARNNFMIVSNANGGPLNPNGSSVTSYSGINPGTLSSVNGAIPDYQTAACWVATTSYGRFAYITNAGSNSISSYYIASWGAVYLIHSVAVTTGAGPKDICVASNNYYVYALNTGAKTIGGFHRAPIGDLVSIGTTPHLPEFATGLVAW